MAILAMKPLLSAIPNSLIVESKEKPLLGFSTGCLYKSGLNLSQSLDFLRSIGCRAVELGFVKLKDFFSREFADLKAYDLRGFDYVSLHAPVAEYSYDAQTFRIFTTIDKVDQLRRFNLVVFHPDTVKNFGIFDRRHIDFNFAFENMDKRKSKFKSVYDMLGLKILDNFKMVLDVNHAYTNDPTLALTSDFYEKLGDRIVEVHLSGYAGRHEPLFQTKQREIIKSIQNTKVPIIVEGIMQPDEIIQERDYILKVLEEA